jgi:arsenate reductase
MAEGFARALAPPDTAVYSAGTEPAGLDPLAVKVMAEVNVDIRRQFSKGLAEVPIEKVDLVVTLCGEGTESCPALHGNVRRLHWPIEDPSQVQGGEEERLRAYRLARSKILRLVSELFG